MKCSKAQRLINDHVDDLLKISDIRGLKSHIQECADCRDLLIEIGSIVDNARELKAIEPSKDLWPEIKRKVIQKDRKVRMPGKGFWEDFSIYSRGPVFALSTVLAVILLVPLIYYGFFNTGIRDNDQERIALEHFRLAEQHYQSAIEALDRVIADQDIELSPELAAVFKKNLEIIDDSIRICKAAVEEYPENSEANKLLLICYTKKVELLNEIKDITLQTG